MNLYRLQFKVVKENVLDPDNPLFVGEYFATVEAESAGEAERKAVAELEKANVGSRHHYLVNRTWDMGPQEEESPL